MIMSDFLIVAIAMFFIYLHIALTSSIFESKGFRYAKQAGFFAGLLPIVGLVWALLTPSEKEDVDIDLLGILTHQMTSAGFFSLGLLFVYLLLRIGVDSSFAGVNSLILKVVIVMMTSVLVFTHSAIIGEVYEKKGYNKVRGSIVGLIPGFGVYRAIRLQSKKQIFKGSFRTIFGFKELVMKLLTYLQLTVAVSVVAFPIIYLIGASFTNTSVLPTLLWPTKNLFTWNNYVDLFVDTNFPTWYKNTFIIAVLNMVLGVVFITGAGYVFARFKFKGKKAGLMTILVLQVFPSFMGLIAMFTLFQVFGLLGKPTWLTVLYVGGSIPGNIWLIKGYLSQIPKDLDESAMLDGASKSQIFFQIILPLSVPILSFVAVGQFMAPWMDYMLPKYLLDVQLAGSTDYESVQKQWTLAVGLFSMISNPRSSSYTTFAAGALIVAGPITILYMIFQRYLIEGIMAGATKG